MYELLYIPVIPQRFYVFITTWFVELWFGSVSSSSLYRREIDILGSFIIVLPDMHLIVWTLNGLYLYSRITSTTSKCFAANIDVEVVIDEGAKKNEDPEDLVSIHLTSDILGTESLNLLEANYVNSSITALPVHLFDHRFFFITYFRLLLKASHLHILILLQHLESSTWRNSLYFTFMNFSIPHGYLLNLSIITFFPGFLWCGTKHFRIYSFASCCFIWLVHQSSYSLILSYEYTCT